MGGAGSARNGLRWGGGLLLELRSAKETSCDRGLSFLVCMAVEELGTAIAWLDNKVTAFLEGDLRAS